MLYLSLAAYSSSVTFSRAVEVVFRVEAAAFGEARGDGGVEWYVASVWAWEG